MSLYLNSQRKFKEVKTKGTKKFYTFIFKAEMKKLNFCPQLICVIEVKNFKVAKKRKRFFFNSHFEHISIFLLITEPLTTKERFHNFLPFPREQ